MVTGMVAELVSVHRILVFQHQRPTETAKTAKLVVVRLKLRADVQTALKSLIALSAAALCLENFQFVVGSP